MVHFLNFVSVAFAATLPMKVIGAFQPTLVALTPFQLELRSIYPSQTQDLASVDARTTTEAHISTYIQNNNPSSIWSQFQSISLDAEEEVMNTVQNRRHLRRKSRSLQAESIYKILFSGSLSFSSDGNAIPTAEEIETIILDAFIGQGKIDYIRLLRTSDDAFLSFTNNAKVWIPSAGNKNSFIIITIVLASIVTILGISAVVYYFCRYRERKNVFINKGQEWQDIRLAATRSMSPTPQESPHLRNSAKQKSQRPQKHQRQHIKRPKNSDSSQVSKDTIDVNGSFDMIAWKNTCLDSKTPFEADLTMISTSSPNKTIHVEIPREVGGRKSSSTYNTTNGSQTSLSKNMLHQHNQGYGRNSSYKSRR